MPLQRRFGCVTASICLLPLARHEVAVGSAYRRVARLTSGELPSSCLLGGSFPAFVRAAMFGGSAPAAEAQCVVRHLIGALKFGFK